MENKGWKTFTYLNTVGNGTRQLTEPVSGQNRVAGSNSPIVTIESFTGKFTSVVKRRETSNYDWLRVVYYITDILPDRFDQL